MVAREVNIVKNYKFRTFLMMWAVPRRAVFCNPANDIWQPSILIFFSKLLVTAPRAPITIGTTMTLFKFHKFFISIFKS